ncbi:phosphoribosyl-ATP diphosphatase [Batrachochytrium salamandrivorans]|nr:hypothetical protein BASA60_007192 [Batrachochytrium salamandrivorans]KAH9267440.1 phosphoribosyl-ATP diphosphatase [Batrachochytrium salamandrivorans]KAJ1340040.1 phosphoribosyl-ATP diphosphatase [Batrachochytrium salamandrivorans]
MIIPYFDSVQTATSNESLFKAAATVFPVLVPASLPLPLRRTAKTLWVNIDLPTTNAEAQQQQQQQSLEHLLHNAAALAVTELDSGADKAIIDLRNLTTAVSLAAVLEEQLVPRERLGVRIAAAQLITNSALLSCLDQVVSLIIVDGPMDESILQLLAALAKENASLTVVLETMLLLPPSLAAAVSDLSNVKQLVPAQQLRLGNATSTTTATTTIDIAKALASLLHSDRPDGLFPTIVVDEHGVALGLCYSNYDSIVHALSTGCGVYHSRTRGLWHKGLTSGATQTLHRIDWDCDGDTLRFTVSQTQPGFCHLSTRTCFGSDRGITHLVSTLQDRFQKAPAGSYTKRLFDDPVLLCAKIREEADELCDATEHEEVAWETADLLYFALTKCVARGVSLRDVERHLDDKSKKITRRTGNAKRKYTIDKEQEPEQKQKQKQKQKQTIGKEQEQEQEQEQKQEQEQEHNQDLPSQPPFQMRHYTKNILTPDLEKSLIQRPIINTDEIMARVQPIMNQVRVQGDSALASLTAKLDGAILNKEDLVERAPFDPAKMVISPQVKAAIDLAFDNIWTFHQAQMDNVPLVVETMPGVVCSRIARPIERVGLYIPGGTAVLPSTALMLGIPAKVAGCSEIVIATPPRKDGTISPEIMYVASKVGATAILKAGGAQAIAAMAYGTETVPKVDKLCGPGNQYVTAAKMVAQCDSSALVAIDMPAGPSELLIVADTHSDIRYVVSDLLSQAEHGADSQVVLVAVGFEQHHVDALQIELKKQAMALPRSAIVQLALEKSYVLTVDSMDDALSFSNKYAPEHLILNVENPGLLVDKVKSAGSVFLGAYSPESCGDYASGTNHTLPTYGFARMYSGVNTHTFLKHITTQELSRDGLDGLGDCVVTLAALEQLEAHRNAVAIRLADIRGKPV